MLLVNAIHVANQVQPGSVLQVESLHENGQVIVDVDILAANGQRYDVTVEAHTSKVLSVKKENEPTKIDGKYRSVPRSGW